MSARGNREAITISDMERRAPALSLPPRKAYERELTQLQIEMLKMQLWVKDANERLLVIFEGRDAAGKGGAIRRFTEHMNPRGARAVALPKPTETETTQWYFQRYVRELPSGGEIVLFDRSWYNRAGVEAVMGYATKRQRGQFYEQLPAFELHLVESGIRLFKLWFTVSKPEQLRRFEARRRDPLRQWKLSPNDEAAVAKFAQYGKARDEMLRRTDSPHAPWTVVNSNVKKWARLESMRHVLHQLPYPSKDHDIVHAPEPSVVVPASALHWDRERKPDR